MFDVTPKQTPLADVPNIRSPELIVISVLDKVKPSAPAPITFVNASRYS